jgi:hypothetical protein
MLPLRLRVETRSEEQITKKRFNRFQNDFNAFERFHGRLNVKEDEESVKKCNLRLFLPSASATKAAVCLMIALCQQARK